MASGNYRVQSQTSLNLRAAMSDIKEQIMAQAIASISSKSFNISRIVDKTFQQGMHELLMKGRTSVSLLGYTTSVSMVETIHDSKLGRALKNSMILGELGISDPEATMKTLADSLIHGFSSRVTTDRISIVIEYVFNANRIVGYNPHPGKQQLNGENISVDSWLQWIVGPKFDSGGTPGYGLIRVSSLLSSGSGNSQDIRKLMARASRTNINAGGDAALMLRTKKTGNRRGSGQLTSFKGSTGKPWKPKLLEANFWAMWWKKNKPAFNELASGIGQSVIAHAITNMNKGK